MTLTIGQHPLLIYHFLGRELILVRKIIRKKSIEMYITKRRKNMIKTEQSQQKEDAHVHPPPSWRDCCLIHCSLDPDYWAATSPHPPLSLEGFHPNNSKINQIIYELQCVKKLWLQQNTLNKNRADFSRTSASTLMGLLLSPLLPWAWALTNILPLPTTFMEGIWS